MQYQNIEILMLYLLSTVNVNIKSDMFVSKPSLNWKYLYYLLNSMWLLINANMELHATNYIIWLEGHLQAC